MLYSYATDQFSFLLMIDLYHDHATIDYTTWIYYSLKISHTNLKKVTLLKFIKTQNFDTNPVWIFMSTIIKLQFNYLFVNYTINLKYWQNLMHYLELKVTLSQVIIVFSCIIL